jgi:hypothetical protein
VSSGPQSPRVSRFGLVGGSGTSLLCTEWVTAVRQGAGLNSSPWEEVVKADAAVARPYSPVQVSALGMPNEAKRPMASPAGRPSFNPALTRVADQGGLLSTYQGSGFAIRPATH